jgi:hypothetical protein
MIAGPYFTGLLAVFETPQIALLVSDVGALFTVPVTERFEGCPLFLYFFPD